MIPITIGGIVCDPEVLDDRGVMWICEDLQGWGSPGGTLQVTQREQDHGGSGGGSWLKQRSITASGVLIAPSEDTALDAINRLCEAVSLDATALVVTEAGTDRQCLVRRIDDVLVTWESETDVSWSFHVVAEDPRKYSTLETSVFTGLPSSSGGLVWPATRTTLNANPFFETDVSNWIHGNGAALATSTAQHHEGTQSAAVTPNGTTANPNILSEEIAVTAAVSFHAETWLWSTAGFTWRVGLTWYDASHTFIASNLTDIVLTPGTWTQVVTSSPAPPAGAVYVRLTIQASGTPDASNVLYVDEAKLIGITGGLAWPIRWDASVTSGLIGVDNVGNIATRPRFVISGPCSDPVITLVGSGSVLSWDLDLAPGQYLDVSVDRRTSLLNGQVSRSGSMTSRGWFDLPKGHSDIAFSASAYDPGATLAVIYRSAWQ